MSARRELAAVMSGYTADLLGTQDMARALGFALPIADAILAAGYSKPRTITTVEELESLGQDSVVRDADGVVYDRDRIVTFPHPLRWHPAGVAADVGSTLIALPATVLYTPKES